MQLRRAQQSDVDRIVELWLDMMAEHRAFDSRIRLSESAGPAYRSYLSLHLASPASIVLVGEDDRVRAFSCSYVCRNLPMFEPPLFGYISDIYIEPERRGAGLGRRMVDDTCDFFRRRGVDSVQLQVYRNNEKGRDFWVASGFEPFFDRMHLPL